MSPLRAASLLLLASLVVAGVTPWTLPAGSVTALLSQMIERTSGLDLVAEGPATVSILPVPRATFGAVSLRSRDGSTLVRDAGFSGTLAIGPLLTGELRFAVVTLRRPVIDAALDEAGRVVWTDVLARLASAARAPNGSPSPMSRLVVTDATVEIASGEDRTRVSDANLVASWPDARGPLDIAASGVWRGEPVTASLAGLHPSALLGGERDPVELKAGSRHAKLSFVGDLGWTDGPSLAGSVSAETASLAGLLRWLDLAPDLAGIDRSVSIGGDATLDRSAIDWPRIRIGLAGDRLDGSLHIALGEPRPKVRATLAGGQIDLGWATRWIETSGTAWAEAAGSQAPGADVDLRLSASGVRLGTVKLKDAAASLLIGPDRLDLSLARATLADGTVKGRLSTALGEAGRDVKGQVTLDRVELGALLGELGQAPLVTGTIAGQAAFETSAEPLAGMARRLTGRVNLTARSGEVSGVTLTDTRRRSPENRAEGGAPPAWRGGRTLFEHANLSLSVLNGVAEISDGSIDSGATQTKLQGRLSLTDRFLSLRATARGQDAAAFGRQPLVLDVNGPLDRLVTLPSSGLEPEPSAAKAVR